jgi:hypothetical protein
MIQFPCRCGSAFQVAEEAAGTQIQCPHCGRLNDVPLLSDLPTLAEDGTVKVQKVEPISREEYQRRLASIQRAYTQYDADGEAIDHRTAPEQLELITPPPLPERQAPKYDPVTGELVRPMDVTPLPPPPAIPFAVKAVGYSEMEGEPMGLGQIALALFQPANVFVLVAVFAVHLAIQMVLIFAAFLWVVGLPIFAILVAMLLAHYGYCIDELGPIARSELPRPLRDLDWREDLWGPFVRVTMALGWCYWVPLLLVRFELPLAATVVLSGSAVLIGSVLFPAILLISATSGSVLNLRPDRIAGTIRALGPAYLVAMFLWLVTGPIYLAGMLGTLAMLVFMFEVDPLPGMTGTLHWALVAASYGLLLSGIYLMHLFCWYIGVQYRRHYDHCPWVLQHHEYRRTPMTAPRKP